MSSVQTQFAQVKTKTLVSYDNGWTHTKAVNVFDDRWRVNVYAKQPNTTNLLVVRSGIVDSLFLIVDGEKVTTEIAKKY
jgi:hypothetical protein